MTAEAEGQRLDIWLFQARFFKSRGLAQNRITGGGVRLNGQPCRKAGRLVRPGDQLVMSMSGQVRDLRIVALGHRRGPPAEAQALYVENVP